MKNNFFLPYQERWIRDTSQIKIMEKSRQIGISWASAYALVRRQSQQSTRTDAWVSSRDEAQARLFLEDCKSFAKILNEAAAATGSNILDVNNPRSSLSLTLANGKRIHCLSSNPDAQAGKRGTRVLDEFALNNDPQQLYTIASPGITWGGQLEIISTHRGSENFFNKLIEEARHGENPKNISLHRVTLQDALEQGFLERLQSKLPAEDPRQEMDRGDYFNFIKDSCPDQDAFEQEYMCKPACDQNAFLPYPLIVPCEYSVETQWQRDIPNYRTNNPLYIGVDIARTNDLTVIYVVEKIEDTFYTRHIQTFQNAPFSQQREALYALLTNPQVIKVSIDQSGLGRQFTEEAIQQFGQTRISGVNFTSSTKEALAYPLKHVFEQRRIRIPDSDILRADLHSVKKEISQSGTLRFTSSRGPDGHADHFWAISLALNAALSQSLSPSHYEPLIRNSRLN